MIKVIGIVLTIIFTSFYLFPFEPAVLPMLNVKTMLAALSIPLVASLLARQRRFEINNDIITILLYALPISLFSWISNVYNNTYDYSFNSYFVSIFVWMGAAFVVLALMKTVHGALNIKLVANYLIAVCCVQCVLALTMVYNSTIGSFVDGLMATGGEAFMGDTGERLHGLGCALDVAGGRFAAVLLMNTYLMTKAKKQYEIYLYILSFLLIATVGSMIGRTTSVGAILCILYLVYDLLMHKNGSDNKYFSCIMYVMLFFIPVVIVLYNVNDVFYENIRFGFEGFFSLVETGKWQTNSTDILTNHMVVFPDNMKTWLIGDGYGANPASDPYYIGPAYHGFYKGTDIGYLRFIFFFGIFGMLSMVMLFICFSRICCRRFGEYREMIILILLLNLIIWFKVTTDLLPIFAILLCISKEDEEYAQQLEDNKETAS